MKIIALSADLAQIWIYPFSLPPDRGSVIPLFLPIITLTKTGSATGLFLFDELAE